MTDPHAPATPPPADDTPPALTGLDADQVLAVELDVVDGVDRPPALFGIPLIYEPDAHLPAMFETNLLAGDLVELTVAGARVAAVIDEELRSWTLTHAGNPPAAIRVSVRPPPPWANPRRDVAEAAANLERKGVPAGSRATSRSAAELARRHAGNVRRQVLAEFVKAAGSGLTDDELSVEVGITPQRVATRRKELQDDGLLFAAGNYRRTRTNSLAVVHKITDLGLDVWRTLNTGPGVGPTRR